jgi:hypothetical protein
MACASNDHNTAGTGGTSTGGAPGTGGSLGPSTGGTTGGETATVATRSPRPCTAEQTIAAPADGLISDFSDPDAGVNVKGGQVLAWSAGSASAPTCSIAGGSLHITLDRPEAATDQYLGVVVGVGGAGCIDAAAFTGVQFAISGSFSGCTLRFLANDDVHQDYTTGAPHAAGPAGSYAPQTTIAADQVTATPRILKLPFDGQWGGSPATPIDPARLILVGWQLDIDANASSTPGSCIADLTIDDVRFYAGAAD